MTKTPREILSTLAMNYTRNPGKESIDDALDELEEALLAAAPHSNMGWITDKQRGYDLAIDQYVQAINKLFNEEK